MHKYHLPIFTLAFLLKYLFVLPCVGQDYIIDLQKDTLTLPIPTFYITKVIDVLLEKNNIGSVQTGLANSRKVAQLNKELPTALQEFFNRNLPAKAGRKPIILKVHKFGVREDTSSFSEMSIAEIEVDFLFQKDPNTYYNLYQAFSVIQRKNIDVTAGHDENIVAALQDCLTQFANLNFDDLISRADLLAVEELEKGQLENTDTLNFAILNDNTYRKGIYMNFMEFRNNNPSITQAMEFELTPRTAKAWKGTFHVVPTLVEHNGKKKNIKRAWGFSDGDQLYINFGGEFYPIQRVGNMFTFYSHVPAGYTAVYAGGLVGGLIGGAIAGAATASATANSKAQFVLDIVSGQITEYSNYSYTNSNKDTSRGHAKIIVYYIGTKASDNQNLALVLTDKTDSLSHSLSVNKSVEFEWTEVKNDLSICLENSPKGCRTFLPAINHKISYIECKARSNNPADGIDIQVLEEKKALFYLKKIKYLQEHEEKKNK